MLPQLDAIEAAVDSLATRLSPVDSSPKMLSQVAGQVLAEPLLADRDSPPIDVSGMDGYAVRLGDLAVLSASGAAMTLPVVATSTAGQPPVLLPHKSAVRIFTGAAVPPEADCVIRREDTLEFDELVTMKVEFDQLVKGQNIRRQGENTRHGHEVLALGTELTSVAMSAVATFAPQQLRVHRKLRVVILNTGDELVASGNQVHAWQIRDSNGPLLESWLGGLPWIGSVTRFQVPDRLEAVQVAIRSAIDQCDAVLMTGGVSMGDTDFVPEAITSLGGEILFHRLPIRPGRPVLGALVHNKLVLGLPGNPVSVAVTSRIIGLPLLRRLAGITPYKSVASLVELGRSDEKSLPLIWYRLVQFGSNHQLELSQNLGSGDLVSLAQSHGIVEIPPGASGTGPWRFYPW